MITSRVRHAPLHLLSLAALLLVNDYCRCRLVHFHLRAYFLQATSESFALILLVREFELDLLLIAVTDWFEPVERFTGSLHRFDFLLVTSRGTQVTKQAGG